MSNLHLVFEKSDEGIVNYLRDNYNVIKWDVSLIEAIKSIKEDVCPEIMIISEYATKNLLTEVQQLRDIITEGTRIVLLLSGRRSEDNELLNKLDKIDIDYYTTDSFKAKEINKWISSAKDKLPSSVWIASDTHEEALGIRSEVPKLIHRSYKITKVIKNQEKLFEFLEKKHPDLIIIGYIQGDLEIKDLIEEINKICDKKTRIVLTYEDKDKEKEKEFKKLGAEIHYIVKKKKEKEANEKKDFTEKNHIKPKDEKSRFKLNKINILTRTKKEKEEKKDSNKEKSEKVIYTAALPMDYRKIIGVFSPYSVGKTTISASLALATSNSNIKTLLVDLDLYKKDLYYHFVIEDGVDSFKFKKLVIDVNESRDIDLNDYVIKINRNLDILTAHRDINIDIDKGIIRSLIRKSKDYNIVIFDIGANLSIDLKNYILEECDEKLLITDKNLTSLNGIPYKLKNINRDNLAGVNLVINKNIKLRVFDDNETLEYFKNISFGNTDKFDINFSSVYKVKYAAKTILEGLLKRRAAFGCGDEEFDKDIMDIALSIYPVKEIKESKETGITEKIKNLIKAH
ncbi:P-loop NTPase family protein [Maledivibacter halophilus]|uniref:AAA domain-containing protein n=1 Tax=Maledivibacter halophilus TaxID=36842 RepID=A0A1T5MG17_9FIRM|nr:AAA family ATPase [Maledivibacter halophilus]SKC86884.1 AAA domain-containing protein [Maledivibacter halophilus]